MLQHLTGQGSAAIAERAISKLLSARAEWFFSEDGGAALPLRNSELDLSVMQHRLIFSCWTEKGARLWRVVGWDWTGEKLLLQARRRMGAERALLELIPRASAKAIIASVAAAREKRSEKLAHIACVNLPGAKVERAALSPGIRRGQPGRYARIILRLPYECVGVTATVATTAIPNEPAWPASPEPSSDAHRGVGGRSGCSWRLISVSVKEYVFGALGEATTIPAPGTGRGWTYFASLPPFAARAAGTRAAHGTASAPLTPKPY